ncbi:MAG: 4-hydroxythreonine-4-phosphate dehydrogenase PdxA, partial [Burkholderiales bacterium]|nr:4-hydroxythreonine-4-phosphate dehydrogenase PdxA [Burkholderiales bacterium]
MTAPAPLLAITMGDACGIGPEIVLKACALLLAGGPPTAHGLRPDNAIADPLGPSQPGLVIYGDPSVLSRTAATLGLPIELVAVSTVQEAAALIRSASAPAPAPGHASPERVRVPVVACSALPPDLPLGRIDARAGHAAHEAIVRASRDAMAGHVAAVVTAPIHKEALHAAGVKHPGHTEILAELAGVDDVRMMLANDELRTLLVTIHVSLREAIDRIRCAAVLDTILIAHAGLQQLGIERPRIAVAGLNPHAGEGGLMGREDIEEIAPAIAQARARGIDATGPWPGDTVFMRARGFREFDLVVAMYHDQGLIPVKYLGLDQGVNVTVGLPFVRTSVDHGTAFDIAGRGIADPSSLLAAITMAQQLAAAPR